MILKTPWLLALIPLAFVLVWWVERRTKSPSFRFSSTELLTAVPAGFKATLSRTLIILRLAALILFIVALAGPRSVLQEIVHKTEGIDIVLAVDCSGSMGAEDFTLNGRRVNRLEAVKDVVADFVKGRTADRIGLVAFGGRAYTVCPLTTDYAWFITQMERLQLGMLEDGTAIGSAISTSLGRLKTSTAKSKVMILLTDGLNNAGRIDPVAAAKAAAAFDVKIYAIGAGTDAGSAPFPVKDFWGRTVYQKMRVDLDESTLKEVARVSRGQYFRATDTDSLKKIYQQIDQLEKTEIEQTGYREYKELFGWFLLAALVLLLMETVLSNTILLKVP